MSKRAHTLVNLGRKGRAIANTLPVCDDVNEKNLDEASVESPAPRVHYPRWFGKIVVAEDRVKTRRKRRHSQATDGAAEKAPISKKTSRTDINSNLGGPVLGHLQAPEEAVSGHHMTETSAMISSLREPDSDDFSGSNVANILVGTDSISNLGGSVLGKLQAPEDAVSGHHAVETSAMISGSRERDSDDVRASNIANILVETDTNSNLGAPLLDTLHAPMSAFYNTSPMVGGVREGDSNDVGLSSVAGISVHKATFLDVVSSKADSDSLISDSVRANETPNPEADSRLVDVNISGTAKVLEPSATKAVPQNETNHHNSDSNIQPYIMNVSEDICSRTAANVQYISKDNDYVLLENISEEPLSGNIIKDLLSELDVNSVQDQPAASPAIPSTGTLQSLDSVEVSNLSRDHVDSLEPVSSPASYRNGLSLLDKQLHTSDLPLSSPPSMPLACSSAICSNTTPHDSNDVSYEEESRVLHNPPACRRLFEADANEVDTWPFLIDNGDGSVLEVTLQGNEGHNNSTPNGSTECTNSLDTSSLYVSTAAGTSSSSNSGKRRRRPKVSNTPAARKRSRDPSQWLVNVRKEAKNAGQSYTTAAGKEMPAKVMGPPCADSCLLKCNQLVSKDDRQKMYRQFYEEKTVKGKWEMIARLTKSAPTQSHELDPISGHNRSCSRQYFFIVKKQQVRVCRKMFLSTLCISESTVRTVYKKLGDGSKISPDKRGGHSTRPHALPETIRQSVLDHINSFPRVASHLCRAETTFEYLEPEVGSVSNMYRLYKEWCTETNVSSQATERQYRKVFNHTPGLKIAFFSPKKDQCDICFSYDHSSLEQKLQKKEEHDKHLKLKQIPREMKDHDRDFARKGTDKEFCAAVFDLEKVLFTPKCNAGALYYRRKLSNYNFTVYDLGKKECFCYCWHEAIAKRGSNEIASFLMKFLVKRIGEGFKRFHLYCDNCSGQNKNRMVYAMLMHIACKFQVDIKLRFLLTGHTQNEGDGAHAIIELNSRKLEMFEPEDWWSYIEQVKQSGEKFKVCRITQEDIFDFHNFVDNLSDWSKNSEGEKPPWSQMQELSFSKEEPWVLQYRCDLDIEQKKSVNTKRVHKGHPVNLATHKFPKAYRGHLPVSNEKLNDLLDMCNGPNPVIPAQKTAVYLSLKSGKGIKDAFYRN